MMVNRTRFLDIPDGSKDEPNSIVKVYLRPHPQKTIKRKIWVVRKNCHKIQINQFLKRKWKLFQFHISHTCHQFYGRIPIRTRFLISVARLEISHITDFEIYCNAGVEELLFTYKIPHFSFYSTLCYL